MPDDGPTNDAIADRLALFAALLELADTSPFAIRAYTRAAELVRTTPTSVADLVRTGRVRDLRGIGPGIEAKLRELVETGEIAELRALEGELHPELVGYGRMRGITGRRMLEIARALELGTVRDFEDAVSAGRLREVPGIGPATETKIRAALAGEPRAPRALTIERSLALSETIAASLGGLIAGEPRRFCELSSRLGIVCAARDSQSVLDRFAELPTIVSVLERDETRAVGLTLEGIPVVVDVVEPEAFGTELVRATGSDDYVAALGPLPLARDEEGVFAALGIAYCPPELRELPGATAPPGLVERSALRGDLHCHTTWSDGRSSVREMAIAARALGHEYLAICDHTPNVSVVPGLDAEALRRQADEIALVNEELAPFRVLRGVELDIRADGSLDADDDVLAELEWVQLSLHAGQRRKRSDLTRMVTEAMRHPAVRALSHPKGRILNHRPENALDLDEVFAVAQETRVALEVNGLPDRLDLSSVHVREALAAGVEIVLNSDAHSARGLERIELALATARKGGATVYAVLNCRPLDAIL